MMENMLKISSSVIGSHIWHMNHSGSDLDLATIYISDSKNILLGKRMKGKQVQDGNEDIVYYEIGHVIEHLLKGNCNYLWAVMSPIVKYEYKSAFRELREIVSLNLSKSTFHSINGLSTHNIYHYITGERATTIDLGHITEKKMSHKIPTREIDPKSRIYKKKLNVIGRTLKFGINLLIWGKCIFEKVDIKKANELYDLKNQLNEAYKHSHLPDKPNPKPFEDYLIKWRLHKLKVDELI